MLNAIVPPPPAVAAPACIHHWLVAPLPSEGSYPASCRRCGAERRFPCLSDWFDFNDALGTLGPIFEDEPGPAPGGDAAARDDVARWAEALSNSLGANAVRARATGAA